MVASEDGYSETYENYGINSSLDLYDLENYLLFPGFNGTFAMKKKITNLNLMVDFEKLQVVDKSFGNAYIALGILISLVNIILMTVILINRKIRKTQINLQIVNLAASHLLMGVLNAPFIGRALVRPYDGSETWGIEENLCWFLSFMWFCLMITPIWCLVIMTIDRMSFVNFMSRYSDAADSPIAIFFLCFPWFMGVACTLILKVAFVGRSRHACIFWYNSQTLHVLWLVLDYASPSFIALFAVAWTVIMYHQNRRVALDSTPTEMRHEVNQSISLCSTIAVCLASAVFIIFQLPTNIPIVIQENCGKNLVTCSIIIHLSDMARFLPALVTPFIWLVFPDIRDALKSLKFPLQYCAGLFHRNRCDNDSVPLQRLQEEEDDGAVGNLA